MSPELQLLLWVAFSFSFGLAVIAYVYRAGGWRREALEVSELGGVVIEVAPFLHKVGLPFLALIAGALSLDLIGLGTDWFSDDHVAGFTPLNWMRGIALSFAAVAFVLAVMWLSMRTAAQTAAEQYASHADQPGFLLTLRDAAYDGVHWAFYRSPFVLLFDDVYWGVIAGLVLIALEWLARSRLQGSARLGDRPHLLVMVCCALTSGLLYLTTRNLWLMIAADATLRWLSARMLTRLAPMEGSNI